MIGLPNDGDLVKIWPMPGRRVQATERPVDNLGGGRFLASSGEEIVWGPFYLHLLRAGDILLHEPVAEKKAAAPAKPLERPRYDPSKASQRMTEELEKAAKEAEPGATETTTKDAETAKGIAEQQAAIASSAKAKKE